MNLIRTGLIAVLLPFLRGTPAPASTSIESLAFMSGCWENADTTGTIEETWMSPRGGTMLGMSRTVRAGKTIAYEALRIEEIDDDLILHAMPSGQPAAEFRATSVETDAVVFENATHDFPQLIRYSSAPDSLHASVEGNLNGQQRSFEFRYGRVPCPAGA